MLFMRDVWVNMVPGVVKEISVPEFFEWRKDTDDISIYDQIPLVRVTEELYDRIADEYLELPEELLALIYNKTFIRKHNQRVAVPYAAIVSDGLRVIAFETDGTNRQEHKSKLIPRQDILALEMAQQLDADDFGYKHIDIDVKDTIISKVFNLKTEFLIGLTRRERDMKEILMECLFQLYDQDNEDAIRYWFTELFWGMDKKTEIDVLSKEDLLAEMVDYLAEGWEEEHVTYGTALTKYLDMYDGIWEDLLKEDRVGK